MQFVGPRWTGCDIETLRIWVSIQAAVLKCWDSVAYSRRIRKTGLGEKLLAGRNILKLELNKIKHENIFDHKNIIIGVCFWRDSPPPTWNRAYLFTRFLDHTHNDAPQRVGLLWTSDQLVAEISTWQHTILTTDKHPCPPVGFEPTISAGERPQTYALYRATTGAGKNIIIRDTTIKHIKQSNPFKKIKNRGCTEDGNN